MGSTTTQVDELNAKILTSMSAAKDLAAKAEAENRDFTDEERGLVKKHLDDAKRFKDEALKAADDDELRKTIAELGVVDPKITDEAVKSKAKGTLGQRFTKSDAFQGWMKENAPSGHIGDKSRVHTPAVEVGGMKDILTGASDTSAGALVQDDRRGLVDTGIYARPLTIRDLVTQGQTGSDTVEYVRETTGVTNAATTVPEASGTSGGEGGEDVTGTKPESEYVLEKVTTSVKTVAHWLPATKRALADAPQVRTLIDNFLRYGLEEELEDQIINGDGSGETFKGLLDTSGVQAQAFDTDVLVTARKARTKVKTVGRAVPTGYVLNPVDNETVDLSRDLNGNFYFGGPAAMGVTTLWGLPRVESEAVPEGTGIVGDWRRAVLWDREQATIQASDSHADFFIRNLIALLAELRAAFGVLRPAAFVAFETSSGS